MQTAFELPVADLQQVAEKAGLQWVGSNPERIAQAQSAMAATATPPARAPRKRPAPAAATPAALVMVETRRDLSSLSLPFEAPATEGSKAQQADS